MKVFPVRYRRRDIEDEGTYFIVAMNSQRAEEIAFECIANNPPPVSEGPDRPASFGRNIAQVWVMESWSHEVRCSVEGLVGSGSESLVAKALALYVEKFQRLS